MNSLPISPALVDALGWTIVHSLWQATLLGGLLWVTSRAISDAKTRYRLAYGILLSQFAVSIFTFGFCYEPAQAVATALPEGGLVMLLADNGASGWQTSQVLPLVVLAWLAALIVGTLRLGFSFGRVRRMRRKAQEAVPADFHRLVSSLADRIGYQGTLRVALSSYVDGPALIGHLKPLLLFPVAMINQLTPEQAEAVIIHELAHLQRKDHWWNLVQCIIEVLFQYHPMIWWIGARIREEREHCCDDVVLAFGPGSLPYAKALLYFETQRSTPATAVALTNNPGGLLGRMQRFLHQQNIPYQMKSRLFLLPLLGLIALVSTAAYAPANTAEMAAAEAATVVETNIAPISTIAPAAAPESALEARVVPLAIDSLPQGRHKVTSYRNGKSTEFVVEDGAIQSLKIDGKDIPAEEFDEHQPIVEQMLGTSEKSESRVFFWNGEKLERDLDNLEDFKFEFEDNIFDLDGTTIEIEGMFENLGESLESWGGSFERLGETMGTDFETIFEDGMRVFRLRSGNNDGTIWNLDSLGVGGNNFRFFADSIQSGDNRIIIRGNTQIIEDGDGGWFMERQRDRDNLSEEEKIREMETMIERMERKKAEMQRELERAKREVEREQRDGERDLRDAQREVREVEREVQIEMREAREEAQRTNAEAREERLAVMRELDREAARGNSPDYAAIVKELRTEGMIPDEAVTRLKLDNDTLKINGKKMSTEAHRRFMEIYKARHGDSLGKQFKVEYKNKEK